MKRLRLSLWMMLAFFGLAQPSAASVIYSTDFDSGAPAGFSGIVTTEPVQDYLGVADFSGSMLRNASVGNPGSKSTLTLTGLPGHESVSLDFLLATIDSWDGGSGNAGTFPDVFNVAVDAVTIFSRTFDNFNSADDSYTGTPLTFGGHRFNGTTWPDAAYDMGAEAIFQNVPHTSSTLVVEWWASGAGWQGGSDESWGIENLTVSIAGVIPEPENYALILAGLGLLGFAARRRRQA
jgi:hypothetical protein